MSRILVVTYSYTGMSLRLAQCLCGLEGWPMGQIEEVAPGRGTWRCLIDSLLRRRPEVEYVGPALRNFEVVVLIAPIWVYQLASPMRSFVAQFAKQLPDIAVISVMGGRGAPNAVAEIGALAHRAPLLSTSFTTREVEDGRCLPRLHAFAEALVKSSVVTEDTSARTLQRETGL